VLIKQLPPESRTWHQRWTQKDELMATAIESNSLWLREIMGLLILGITRKPPKNLPDADLINHPDRNEAKAAAPVPKKKIATTQEMMRFFGGGKAPKAPQKRKRK
jgi:hypothetical protein